jgi:hypothetical protein
MLFPIYILRGLSSKIMSKISGMSNFSRTQGHAVSIKAYCNTRTNYYINGCSRIER